MPITTLIVVYHIVLVRTHSLQKTSPIGISYEDDDGEPVESSAVAVGSSACCIVTASFNDCRLIVSTLRFVLHDLVTEVSIQFAQETKPIIDKALTFSGEVNP
ncbi:unnamed protein product [Cylicocyclus nassatus]|uniref:Uncharacterized protein n=1 Tax=Cylicocyclus nassatus TaxID=53992 RepID=A0AA36H6J3_CYLNA|nr:unnamed protein product [Cylicocyclus nassatus]